MLSIYPLVHLGRKWLNGPLHWDVFLPTTPSTAFLKDGEMVNNLHSMYSPEFPYLSLDLSHSQVPPPYVGTWGK